MVVGLWLSLPPIIVEEKYMKYLIHCTVALVLTGLFTVLPQHAIAQEQKSILVTGASTGTGRHLAEALAADGQHVYAGARKDEDLTELGAIENITAVRLDVAGQDQVDAAVTMIKEKGTGLYALVNNAGLGGAARSWRRRSRTRSSSMTST